MNNKRTGKFYRKNEASVMKLLGLNPTPNSGSGWIVKEDGESEDIICQLKSTDANSIKVNKKDIDTLIYHAIVSHKIPVFAIQFLKDNEVYLLVKPEDLYDVSQIMQGKRVKNNALDFELNVESTGKINRRCIKSSSSAREAFINENDGKFKKRSKSAK